MTSRRTLGPHRSALEALRNGVPNHNAVRTLGCDQPAAEKRFREQLKALERRERAPGLLVSGGFGSGKSHLLEFLEGIALENSFVCSRIVISKETPLYDVGKVYRAAVDQALVPGATGQAIQEIAQMLKPDSESYAAFYQWANRPDSGLPQLFPATLFLHERMNQDPELVENVTGFWAGDKIAVPRVRQGLKQLAASGTYAVRPVPVKTLGICRFAFASQLIRAAGLKGWVLLIDEVELVGRYSPLQRGRSYAELARWVTGPNETGIDGVTTVMAITDDFALLVLEEKGDRQMIGAKLRNKATSEYSAIADHAEVGMEIIERDAVPLRTPNDSILAQTYSRLKEIHSSAYAWDAPEIANRARSIQRPMRSYVRRWISEWDLRRLYPNTKVDLQEDEIRTDYAEDRDLETFEGTSD